MLSVLINNPPTKLECISQVKRAIHIASTRNRNTALIIAMFTVNNKSPYARGNITKINNGIIGLAKYNIRF
jgi:hypothetical protein